MSRSLGFPAQRFSVVVCTHNRAALLKACIHSLLLQDYPKTEYEIIVVDDGSTDNTADVLADLAKEHPRLKVIRQPRQGPALARNQGAAAATGDTLVFLDDDAEATPEWLTAIHETFAAHPQIHGLGSHTILTFASGQLDKRRYWDNPLVDTLMPLAFEPQKWLSTHNLAVKKSAFDAVHGFRPEPLSHDEDLDFLYRLLQHGFQLLRTGKTVVFHRSRETCSSILRQQFHFGRTDVHVFRRFFPRQLVLDIQVARFLRLKDFYCFRNFPCNCCLRIDFFKGFLLALILSFGWVWLPVAYLLALGIGIFLQNKNVVFSLVLLRTLLLRDAAYLAGHVRGSWEARAIYL